jgi:hypothetical protein
MRIQTYGQALCTSCSDRHEHSVSAVVKNACLHVLMMMSGPRHAIPPFLRTAGTYFHPVLTIQCQSTDIDRPTYTLLCPGATLR